jgi:hypothetical protein
MPAIVDLPTIGKHALAVCGDGWTDTAACHRDCKQLLGLGDSQGRTGASQTRYGSLVSAASRARMRSVHRSDPRAWAW